MRLWPAVFVLLVVALLAAAISSAALPAEPNFVVAALRAQPMSGEQGTGEIFERRSPVVYRELLELQVPVRASH